MLSKFIDDEKVAVFPLKSVWPFVRSNKKKPVVLFTLSHSHGYLPVWQLCLTESRNSVIFSGYGLVNFFLVTLK